MRFSIALSRTMFIVFVTALVWLYCVIPASAGLMYPNWYFDAFYNPQNFAGGIALGYKQDRWGAEIAYSSINQYSNSNNLIANPCPTPYTIVNGSSLLRATGVDGLYYLDLSEKANVFVGVGVYGGYNREIVKSTVYENDSLYQQSQTLFVIPAGQIGLEYDFGILAARIGYHTFRGAEIGFSF